MPNKNYYKELGWLSPSEIVNISLSIVKEGDIGASTLLSQLAFVRNSGTLEDELELSNLIQEFLRRKYPLVDEISKINKAKYN